MKKNLFFAALAAMALTVGLTSCSNDDDANADNSFKETYTMRYDFVGATDAEETLIRKTINAALAVNDTVTRPQITISGKDSADCTKQFVAKIEPAIKELGNHNFDSNEHNSITVYNANSYIVYSKFLGTTENGGIKTVVKPFYTHPRYTGGNNTVHQLAITNNSTWNYNDSQWVYWSCSMDVNYKSGSPTDVFIMSKEIVPGEEEWINDVIVLESEAFLPSNTDLTTAFNINGVTYHLAMILNDKGEEIEDSWKYLNYSNLNRNSLWGRNLYLYYSTAYEKKYTKANDRTLLHDGLAICYRYKSSWWSDEMIESTIQDFDFSEYDSNKYSVEFAELAKWDKNANAYVKTGKPANLNSSYSIDKSPIYLRCVYDNHGQE